MPVTSVCATNTAPRHSLLCLHDFTNPPRDALESFIHTRYAETYGATVSHFLPYLLARWQGDDVSAVVGLRPGSCGDFFVEHYLDTPIEQVVAQRQGIPVAREDIIETGNLAASRGASQLLFIILTEVLYRAGFHWITFTATAQVNALLHRLGFAPQVICRADVNRLGDAAKDWGSYYDNLPSVVVGDIRLAHRTLQSNELAQKLLQEFESEVAAISATLGATRQGVAHE